MTTTPFSCTHGAAGSGILSGGKISHCEAPLVPVHNQAVPSVAGPCLGRCETNSVWFDAGIPRLYSANFPYHVLGLRATQSTRSPLSALRPHSFTQHVAFHSGRQLTRQGTEPVMTRLYRRRGGLTGFAISVPWRLDSFFGPPRISTFLYPRPCSHRLLPPLAELV